MVRESVGRLRQAEHLYIAAPLAREADGFYRPPTNPVPQPLAGHASARIRHGMSSGGAAVWIGSSWTDLSGRSFLHGAAPWL